MNEKILVVGLALLILMSGCLVTVDPQSLDLPEPPPVENPIIEIPTSPPDTPTLPDVNETMAPPDVNEIPPVVTPPVQPPAEPTITLSLSEVAKHAKKKDCWMIISGNVYDLSAFVNHPGGTAFIPYCGKDGTKPYNAQGHSNTADAMLKKYYLGAVGSSIPAPKAG